jgi:hypothetical protein
MIGIGLVGGARFAATPARLVLACLGAALGSFAISLCIAAAFAALASLLMPEPTADITVAYLPGAIDAMMVLALALDLDPIRRRPSPRAFVWPVARAALRDPLGAWTRSARRRIVLLTAPSKASG